MLKKIKNYFVFILAIFITLLISPLHAQNKPEKPDVKLFKKILSPQEANTSDDTKEQASGKKEEKEITLSKLSIFFSENDIKNVKTAIEAHTTDVPLEILLPELFPSAISESSKSIDKDKKTEPKQLPSAKNSILHLKSLMYFNQDNWALWINNNKISSKLPHPFLKVLKIKRDSVSFAWENIKINESFPNWQNYLKKGNSNIYINKDKSISYNANNNKLIFKLSPNQTINFADMSVIEGNKYSSSKGKQSSKSSNAKKSSTDKEKPEEQDGLFINPIKNLDALKLLDEYKSRLDSIER